MANGQKAGFTAQELARLRDGLHLWRDYRGLALLNVAVDTMLRVSDLRRLKVRDFRRPDGTWRDTFTIGMRKTDGTPVECAVLPHSHAALAAYIAAYRLGDDDELFGMSTKTIERTVKAWAVSLGRDARDYGCHSLRRSKAALLAADCSAQDLDDIRELLGHRWLSSTQSYLGTNRKRALARAHSFVV